MTQEPAEPTFTLTVDLGCPGHCDPSGARGLVEAPMVLRRCGGWCGAMMCFRVVGTLFEARGLSCPGGLSLFTPGSRRLRPFSVALPALGCAAPKCPGLARFSRCACRIIERLPTFMTRSRKPCRLLQIQL